MAELSSSAVFLDRGEDWIHHGGREGAPVTYPTISAQISTLEKNIGHKLFRQVGRRLEPTQMGQLTYRYANDIFSLGEELQQTLAGKLTGGHVALKVGIADVMPKPIAYRILAPALTLPEIHAVCYEGKPAMLMAQLAVHELDLVLLTFRWGRSSRLMPLATCLAKAVCPSSPPLQLPESIRKDSHVLWKALHSFYRLRIHQYDARWITGLRASEFGQRYALNSKTVNC